MGAAADEAFGKLDILINNAGATQRGAFLDLDDDAWEDGFALKFYACVRLSRLFLAHVERNAEAWSST